MLTRYTAFQDRKWMFYRLAWRKSSILIDLVVAYRVDNCPKASMTRTLDCQYSGGVSPLPKGSSLAKDRGSSGASVRDTQILCLSVCLFSFFSRFPSTFPLHRSVTLDFVSCFVILKPFRTIMRHMHRCGSP